MPPRRKSTAKRDRISNLPDTVLSHVLSFLPTEDAVATSVLSKRWRQVWRLVPALDLSDEKVDSEEKLFRFTAFVYHTLMMRDTAQPIQRFRINIQSDYYDDSAINKWVDFVLQRKVEHLDLYMISETLVYETELPLDILSCRTLVVLKLNGYDVSTCNFVELPSLKILHLRNINFRKPQYFMLLLAGCPILEDLQTYRVFFGAHHPSTYQELKSLSLTKLNRAQILCYYGHLPLKPFDNAELLCIEIDKVYNKFDDIPTFHNLTHLKLIFLKYNWHLIAQVLNHCPRLQNLVLDEDDMDEIEDYHEDDQESWADLELVPECLSLHLKTCTLGNFSGLQCELLLARYILKKARVLKTMTIYYRFPLSRRIKEILSLYPRSSVTCQLLIRYGCPT